MKPTQISFIVNQQKKQKRSQVEKAHDRKVVSRYEVIV